jgi:hypothetical protein
LRNPDISEQAIRKVLSPTDYDLLLATLDLKKSRETNDPMQEKRSESAYKKLLPRLGLAGFDDLPKILSTGGWANVHVPRLATPAMEEARLVLWGCSGRFIPAIYCPNLRTAIFVRAFLALQTCPHCGTVFIPEKENVIYCRPAHGQAHRMARSRYLKALRDGKRKQARKNATTKRNPRRIR